MAGKKKAGDINGNVLAQDKNIAAAHGRDQRSAAAAVLDTILILLGKTSYLLFHLLGWKPVALTGTVIGELLYRLRGHRRQEVRRELAVRLGNRLGNAAIDALTRKSFINYYQRHAETIFFGALDRKRVDSLVQALGVEHIDQALADGKGVIVLLSHFGSFLLPLPFLGFRGYRVNQIAGQQIHTSLVNERIWRWRKKEADRLPISFIQVDRFLRPIYRALRQNEVVAIAFDGRSSRKWVEVPFFEGRERFSPGPFEMARRTGATIIPTFVIRKQGHRHCIVFEPPFALDNAADPERAVARDTENFARLFARYVEAHPDHFGMLLPTLKEVDDL